MTYLDRVELDRRRPVPIALLCIIGIGSVALSLLLVPRVGAEMASAFGWWYVPLWLASLAGTVVSLLGYWRMRRWGVYLYAIMFALATAIGGIVGLPFTTAGVVVPALIIALGLTYLGRMT